MPISTGFSIAPTMLAKTQSPLAGAAVRPAETKAAGEAFAKAMETAGGTAASQKVAADDVASGKLASGKIASAQSDETTIRPLVKHEVRKVPALEQFEGFVLRSFIESMLPSEESEFYGKGTAGAIWKSKMAEEIGNEIAKGGGIGIADSIAKKDPVSAGDRARADAAEGLTKLRHAAGASAAATLDLKTPGG